MKIEINKQIKDIIKNIPGNKTVKSNALKIYGALYLQSKRANKFGYFPVPSDYLKSINSNYSRIVEYFKGVGLIKVYTRTFQDDNDVFNTIEKKYYDTERGICMKYKFLIPTSGEFIEVDLSTHRKYRWYDITFNSLINFGFEDIKITRDTFGRRVHHSAIIDYKTLFKGFWTIDSIASQPRLLYLDMKEKGIIDEDYNYIFENDLDFYNELQTRLKLKERQEAKDLFMYWIGSKGYVPNKDIHKLFPIADNYIQNFKITKFCNGDYKAMCSHLQRLESNIWIDDILNNIPIEFCLPIHDCIIVDDSEIDGIIEWISNRYPNLRFKQELIK